MQGHARVTQDHPEDPAPAAFATLVIGNRRSKAKIHLRLFPGLAFQAPDPLRLLLPQLAHKPLHRLIGVREPVLGHPVLKYALRTETPPSAALQRGAVLYTVVENCRRQGIDPLAYLRDVLTRLPKMLNSEVASITPETWADGLIHLTHGCEEV